MVGHGNGDGDGDGAGVGSVAIVNDGASIRRNRKQNEK